MDLEQREEEGRPLAPHSSNILIISLGIVGLRWKISAIDPDVSLYLLLFLESIHLTSESGQIATKVQRGLLEIVENLL